MLRQSGSATLPAPASPAPLLQQRLSSGLQIPFMVQNPQARLSLPTCLSGGRGAQQAFWEGKSRRKGGMNSNANPQGEQRGRDRDQHWQSQVSPSGTGRTAPANAPLLWGPCLLLCRVARCSQCCSQPPSLKNKRNLGRNYLESLL